MVRSKLKNKANKTKNSDDIARYRKQRNLVVNLNRRAKKSYFNNSMHSSKSFWKSVKPYVDSKCRNGEERLILVQIVQSSHPDTLS